MFDSIPTSLGGLRFKYLATLSKLYLTKRFTIPDGWYWNEKKKKITKVRNRMSSRQKKHQTHGKRSDKGQKRKKYTTTAKKHEKKRKEKETRSIQSAGTVLIRHQRFNFGAPSPNSKDFKLKIDAGDFNSETSQTARQITFD